MHGLVTNKMTDRTHPLRFKLILTSFHCIVSLYYDPSLAAEGCGEFIFRSKKVSGCFANCSRTARLQGKDQDSHLEVVSDDCKYGNKSGGSRENLPRGLNPSQEVPCPEGDQS